MNFDKPSMLRVKRAIRQRYAWPGGYEIFLITQDGGTLCCNCARTEYRQLVWDRIHNTSTGWNVAGIDNASNTDGPVTCDHCYRAIVEENK